jgi:hypothetical protein
MKNILIGFTGKAQSGKTTASDALEKLVKADGLEFRKISFAEPLKQLCKDWFDWDGSKEIFVQPIGGVDGQDVVIQDKGRQLLINVGMKMREIRGTIWADLAYKKICEINVKQPEGIVLTMDDVRFRNELHIIAKVPNSLIVNLNRPNGQLSIDDISEKDLDDVVFENKILNNGSIEDLAKRVEEFYKIAKQSNN